MNGDRAISAALISPLRIVAMGEREMNRTLFLVFAAIVLGPIPFMCETRAAAQSLREVRAQVDVNFERIESLFVRSRIIHPRFSGGGEGSGAVEYEWAFRSDGRSRIAFTPRFHPLGEAPSLIDIAVFDGDQGRTVTYDRSASKQETGSFLTVEQVHSKLIERPPASTEFGRAFGWNLNGRDLPQWLLADEARLGEERLVGGDRCLSIEVEEHPRFYKFFLARDRAFALKRWESYNDGDFVMSVEVTQLKEIEDGLWMPLSGRIEGPDRLNNPDGSRQNIYEFEVHELHVNEPQPNELYEIEWDPGLYVYDFRFDVALSWGRGAAVGASGLDIVSTVRNVEDRENLLTDIPTRRDASAVAARNSPQRPVDTERNAFEGGARLIMGVILIGLSAAVASAGFIWAPRRRKK